MTTDGPIESHPGDSQMSQMAANTAENGVDSDAVDSTSFSTSGMVNQSDGHRLTTTSVRENGHHLSVTKSKKDQHPNAAEIHKTRALIKDRLFAFIILDYRVCDEKIAFDK